MPKLLLFLQDGSTREVLFDKDRITIGRRSDNDVALPYPAVSGRHAVISSLSASKCFVEDLKSTNGTLLNGAPIFERQQLKDRDQIDVGGQKFVFLEGGKGSEGTEKAKPEDSKTGKKPKSAPGNAKPSRPLALASIHEHLNKLGSISFQKPEPVTPEQDAPEPAGEEEFEEEVVSGLHYPTIFKTSSYYSRAAKKEAGPLPMLDAGWTPPATEDPTYAELVQQFDDLDQLLHSLPPPPPPAVATLTAVSGPNKKRALQLCEGDYVLGRPGHQLAMIQVTEEGCRLFQKEGEPPIEVRGQPVPTEGVLLVDQDSFTIGRSPLLFELSKPDEDEADTTPDQEAARRAEEPQNSMVRP